MGLFLYLIVSGQKFRCSCIHCANIIVNYTEFHRGSGRGEQEFQRRFDRLVNKLKYVFSFVLLS